MMETSKFYGKEVNLSTKLMFKWCSKKVGTLVFPLMFNTLAEDYVFLCDPADLKKEGVPEVLEEIQKFMGKNQEVLYFLVNGIKTFESNIKGGEVFGIIDVNKMLQGEKGRVDMQFSWELRSYKDAQTIIIPITKE